jgi:hypothetical protein
MSKEFVDTKNIVDLSNLDSWDLVKELNNRGYYTKLIFSPMDVESMLDSINSDRDEDDTIVLTDNWDKMEILDNCFNTDYYCQRMNEDIEQHILDYYDNEDYYKKEENVEE